MRTKTWIKVKCGLLDPEHVDKLQHNWYLFLYMLDMADWATGTIPEWKDEYAAEEFRKPINLIREHRKQLQKDEYIICEKQQYCQHITIYNYSDPRRYDGAILNRHKPQSSDKTEVRKDQSSGQSYAQSSGQTTISHAVNSHSSYSHIKHINTLINKDIVIKEKSSPTFSTDTIDRLFSYGVAKSVIREVNTSTNGWTDAAVNRLIDDLRERKGDDIGGLLANALRSRCPRKYLDAVAIEDRNKYANGVYASVVNH